MQSKYRKQEGSADLLMITTTTTTKPFIPKQVGVG
jgi:hypothetical protein